MKTCKEMVLLISISLDASSSFAELQENSEICKSKGAIRAEWRNVSPGLNSSVEFVIACLRKRCRFRGPFWHLTDTQATCIDTGFLWMGRGLKVLRTPTIESSWNSKGRMPIPRKNKNQAEIEADT